MRTDFFLLCLLVAIPSLGQSSQDMIYPADAAPIACFISDVTPQEIKYKHPENREGPDYVLGKDKALLVFKHNGEFLIPGQQDDWLPGADGKAHRIVTKAAGVYPARFLAIEGDQVAYQDAQNSQRHQISKEEVLLVIYQDGRHQLFAPPAEAAQGLSQVATKLDQYITPNGGSPSAGGEGVLELDDELKAHFEKMALIKANDFGKYLTIISNKDEVEEDKLMAVSHATKLFMSDSSKIQVSSLNQADKRQYTVPVYLDRLRMLPYDKVELIWVKAQMVSKFRKGMDGRYYGMIAAQQLFRGYQDNKIVYQDVTKKDIEVVLDQYVVFDEGQQKKKWDVLLSSVNVKQTREK